MLRRYLRGTRWVAARRNSSPDKAAGDPLSFLPIIAVASQYFGFVSVLVYTAGFLTIRSRLGTVRARSGLSVADARYLVEGAHLLLFVAELLLPYLLLVVVGTLLYRVAITLWKIVRLQSKEMMRWRVIRVRVRDGRVLGGLVVAALLKVAVAGGLNVPVGEVAPTPSADSVAVALLYGTPWHAWSGCCRFELITLLLVASAMTLRFLPKNDWMTRVAWVAVVLQAVFLPITYSQLVDFAFPIVTIRSNPFEPNRTLTAYMLWSTDSEYLLHDGEHVLYVPVKDTGVMVVDCYRRGVRPPKAQPQCGENEKEPIQ